VIIINWANSLLKLIWFLLPSNTTLYYTENNQLGFSV
jgi:hypothetical protein